MSLYFNKLGRAPAGRVGFLVAAFLLRFRRLRDIDRVGSREGFLQRLVKRAVLLLLEPAFLVLIAVDVPGLVHGALLRREFRAFRSQRFVASRVPTREPDGSLTSACAAPV